MGKEKNPEHKNITGIISDSGWKSLPNIAETIVESEIKKRFKKSMFSFMQCIAASIIKCLYRNCFKQSHIKNKCYLPPAFQHINCPVLLIHSEDDTFVNIEESKAIAKVLPHHEDW